MSEPLPIYRDKQTFSVSRRHVSEIPDSDVVTLDRVPRRRSRRVELAAPFHRRHRVAIFWRGRLCYNKAARLVTLVCEDRMSSVIDDYLVDPRVSLLDKTRMQAQVLVPVLRALRAELGKDKADAIVKQALRDWSKQLFAAIGDGIEGSPRRKWTTIQSVFGEVSGKEVEARILRHDKEALDIDVTRCRFAEFFRALGEPELGALLICETDFDIASVGAGEVSLERAQTLMQGGPSCTFRYKFAPR